MHPPKYEAKELRAGEALLHGFLIGLGAEHVATSDETRVDRSPDRLATGADELPVAGHPFLRVLWRLKADTQCPDAEPGREHDGFRARRGHPHRWVRFLQRLGNDIALGHAEVFPLITGVRNACHHAQTFTRGLFPRLLLLLVDRVEAAYFSGRGALTRAELDAAARHEIEGGNALCHPRWMVLLWRHLHDAVPQPN